MKKRFEINVASEIPKTRLHEPELPWKISGDDLDRIASAEEDSKDAATGTPPLKVRAPFIIMLVAAVFAVTSYLVINSVMQSERIRSNMLKKDKEASALKADAEKLASENLLLGRTSVQLEKKVGELSAQKELFTGVIESLTKRNDEIEAARAEGEKTASDQVR